MPSEGRKQAFLDGLVAFCLALGVHVLFGALLVVSAWDWPRFDRPVPPVRVTLVDMGPMIEAPGVAESAAQDARDDEAERRERELAEQRAAEQERQRQIERRERELAERRAEREAERQRELELQRRREEQQRRIAEERQREEQRREQELAELRERREQAQREREEQERRLAELARQSAAAEQARREREQAEAAAERLRLAQARAAEEARRATLGEEYVSTIRELVRRSWIRPPTTRPGVECRVRVVQIPGGEIIAAEIIRPCNADDATRRSITAAVLRVGELPYRGYEDVFAREIDFDFRYDG